MNIVYETSNILARGRLGVGDRRVLFVTFCPWIEEPSLLTEGFGERFLAREGIDAVHVVTAKNDWFQNDDTRECIEVIKEIASNYDLVVTYGSSMGGYGALNFGPILGARRIIAQIPQFSIWRGDVPHEERWINEAHKYPRICDHMKDPLPEGCRAYVLFDPYYKPDRRQVHKITEYKDVTLVKLPFIGHTGVDGEILKYIVMSVVAGDETDLAGAAYRAHRASKRQSGVYYFQIARLRPSLARETRLALLVRAGILDPGNFKIHHEVARELSSAGRHLEALYVLKVQTLIHPGKGALFSHIAQIHASLGDASAALENAETAVRLSPSTSWFQHHLASLLSAAGRNEEAMTAQEQAISLAPLNAAYQCQAGRIADALGNRAAAVVFARRATELAGDNFYNWHTYAHVAERADMIEVALSAAERALELAPDNRYCRSHVERLRVAVAESPGDHDLPA